MNSGRATRSNGSTLVEPNSPLAIRIAQNFYQFEEPSNITVYQPPQGPLRVELKRLELDFVVTKAGLLLCPQLGAVVAETCYQDVGTWYGLRSKLVVRSFHDHTQRSILLPLGTAIHKREGSYTSIVIQNEGSYLRFKVNFVLGRIECASDDLLLCHRALWHACTSNFLPDSLTGRTGLEEALYYLSLGSCQPWKPLPPDVCKVLLRIASLSPQRTYYPATLKAMECVHWDHSLPQYIQDDRYRRTVNEILLRNKALQDFSATGAADKSRTTVAGELHLENRSLSRMHDGPSTNDRIYKPRDGRIQRLECANVASIAGLLFNSPASLPRITPLASLLANRPLIGGYIKVFDKIQFTDLLEADLGVEWGSLVMAASKLSSRDRFRATFLLMPLAFSSQAEMDLIRTIAAFVILPELQNLRLPRIESYTVFQPYQTSDVQSLVNVIDEARVPAPRHEPYWIQQKHDEEAARACQRLAAAIQAQWPNRELDMTSLGLPEPTLLDRHAAVNLVLPAWAQLIDNFAFFRHVEEVQTILFRHSAEKHSSNASPTFHDHKSSELYPLRIRGGDILSLADVLSKNLDTLRSSAVATKPFSATLVALPNGSRNSPAKLKFQTASHKFKAKAAPIPRHVSDLKRLVLPLRSSASMVQRRYGAELEHSIDALSTRLAEPVIVRQPFNPTGLQQDIDQAKASYQAVLEQLHHALRKSDIRAKWLTAVGLWPKMSPIALLAALRSTSGIVFGVGVKEALLNLGIIITKYQRLLRIKDAVAKGRVQQMNDEYDNVGHANWSPAEHVDWLLLEIDGDILLRQEQIEVALATISPTSGQNSVLQLLMGRGKTSCILPMVALELANNSLFRIVVPRQLLLQSAQIMQAKLGGLLNREIVHIPFSRKTPTNKTLMQAYSHLHAHVQSRKGIMLALPEHLLSFRLSGLQQLCDGNIDEAALMIETQARFDRYARDVLDECDVLLAIRTQLIYPSGSQRTVDGHPLRWQTVQSLLDLVRSHLDDLMQKFPNSIEIVTRIGFPLLYFLRKDVEEYLIERMAREICQGQTTILPVRDYPQDAQRDMYDFITVPLVDPKVTEKVLGMFGDQRHLVDVVLHLRGLIVHRILLSALKKRWNVQYGLHITRTPIAVPYQAKGVPSPSSEWGHPDVAIVLTCLSFYYEGLSVTQLKRAFEQLAKADEPSIEYSLWTAEDVPEAFKNFKAINVEDGQQLRELHGQIKFKVRLIDFYLNNFVFPQHAKQFSKKLSASGSDLVLYDPKLPTNTATTGFSGTNDSRHQLPMSIEQNDLPQLAHTNAEVPAYLLELRNRQYVRMVDSSNKRLSESGFLRMLFYHKDSATKLQKPIKILIDAGAQILEHSNFELAKAWLEIDTDATAAVYLGDDHRLMVVYGKGMSVPLVASPFAENLDGCLVYIDESHCRGTDLRLPPHARAALTLGPHLTKDALAQAAMRLRLLGTTQSVTFFSPPEVHQSILDLRASAKAKLHAPLDSFDVLRWLLDQSCNAIEQLEPLYFNQSINYLQRTQAKLDHPDFLTDTKVRDTYLGIMRSKELHSLRQLYEPKNARKGAAIKASAFDPVLRPYVSEVLQRRKDFQDRGIAVQSAALEEVEQEREMEFEIECVREVQQPVHFKALRIAKLHPDIEDFALTGRLPAGSDAFQPMFYALQKTALGNQHGTIMAAAKAARLYVSTQYTRAVSLEDPNDNFIRPCHWLLWSCATEIGLILSPEEADVLIPVLRQVPSDKSACHLIVYVAPVTRQMLQFNVLDYYAIPTLPSTFIAPNWLKIELGIFAGRLYFEWDEYEELASYLGIRLADDMDGEHTRNARDGAFAMKPLAFLHEWLAIRRKGQDFEHTPMGYITTGKPLSASHPFFSTSRKEQFEFGEPSPVSRVTNDAIAQDDESDDDDDHANDHLFKLNDDEEGDVFHDAEEDIYNEDDNTFLDGKEYREADEDAADGN